MKKKYAGYMMRNGMREQLMTVDEHNDDAPIPHIIEAEDAEDAREIFEIWTFIERWLDGGEIEVEEI